MPLTGAFFGIQDCRDVEDIVQNTFAAPDGPSGLVVWVGSRSECVLLSHSPSPFATIDASRMTGGRPQRIHSEEGFGTSAQSRL